MSRDLPTGYAALTTSAVFRPALLVALDWPGGMVRAWSGYGPITWDGETYLGTGHLGTVSPIEESVDGGANGVTLMLSGIPTEIIAEALANDSQGRSGKLWLAGMAADGTLAADPYLIFDGVIDICPIEYSGETATVAVKLEKELVDRRLQQRRYTHEDQQIDYPGDKFFEFVAGLANREVTWGSRTVGGSTAQAGAVRPSDTSDPME